MLKRPDAFHIPVECGLIRRGPHIQKPPSIELMLLEMHQLEMSAKYVNARVRQYGSVAYLPFALSLERVQVRHQPWRKP